MLAASMAGVYIKLLLVFDNVTSVGRPKDDGLFGGIQALRLSTRDRFLTADEVVKAVFDEASDATRKKDAKAPPALPHSLR